MSNEVLGQKKGGQELIGGMDVTMNRNHYGTQLSSFHTTLSAPCLASANTELMKNGTKKDSSRDCGSSSSEEEVCEAVFIRAPAIVRVGPSVEVLASVPLTASPAPSHTNDHDAAVANEANANVSSHSNRMPVAVREGSLLATTFHPELSQDARWHAIFVNIVREDKKRRLGQQTKPNNS